MDEPSKIDRSPNGAEKSVTPPPARLLTFAQAQAYLGGLSKWKLRLLATSGNLPIVVFALNGEEGCRWFFDRADLDSLIARSKKIL